MNLKNRISKVLVSHFYGNDEKCIKKELVCSVIFKKDVVECIKDFNYFMKYSKIKNNLPVDVNNKIWEIMQRYNMSPILESEIWTCEKVSKCIFGDFEN